MALRHAHCRPVNGHPWWALTWYVALERRRVVGVSANRYDLSRCHPNAEILTTTTALGTADGKAAIDASKHTMIRLLREARVI